MNYLETLMWKELSFASSTFENILKNNEQTIKAIKADIEKSGKKQFMLSARGTSDHAMMYFKYLLETKTEYCAGYVAPSIVTVYNGKVNYGHTVFIGCSQSGMAVDVNESIIRANEQGAITVAITNNTESLMAKTAKYHLFCSAEEEKSVAATKTYSAQLFLSAWLVAELANDGKLLDALKKLPEEVRKLTPSLDLQTTQFANEELVGMKGGFVLSRGLTYSIAFEQALKLQETAYKQMKGYASSDFYHGPMAMVDKTTPVLFYCAKGMTSDIAKITFEDQSKSIDKMLSMSAPVYLITDDENIADKYNGKAKVAFIDNSLGEECSIFFFALFAQMFACKVSCAVGNNPDSPRVLNKVTITK